MIKQRKDAPLDFSLPVAFPASELSYCEDMAYAETGYSRASKLSTYQLRRWQQVLEKYQYIHLVTLAYATDAVRWLLESKIPFGVDVMSWCGNEPTATVALYDGNDAMRFKLTFGGAA